MKYFAYLMRFAVLGLIYVILYRIVRTMYLDLKDKGRDEEVFMNFAMEVLDCPESLDIRMGSVYPVRSSISIGRGEDNNIVLKDPFVSHHHAEVYVEDTKLYVKDLGSTNGVLRNGKSVRSTSELSAEDEVKIGRTTFKIIG